MPHDLEVLFQSLLSVGAILAGFCGTFLAFRIQREAKYSRQGLAHFTSPLLLLLCASAIICIFGILFPILALAGSQWLLSRSRFAVAGVVAAIVLLAAYFVDELVH